MAWPRAFASSRSTSKDDPDKLLDQLLLEGKIDAVIGPNVLPSITARDPRMRRLFRDFRKEEQNYYARPRFSRPAIS